MMTVNEAAEKWGLSAKSVRFVCNAGRIKGAKKVGRTWVIPDYAGRPVLTVGRPRLFGCQETALNEAEQPSPTTNAEQFTQEAKSLLNALYNAYKAYNPQGVYLAVAINGDTIRVNNSYWSYDWQRPMDVRWEVDSNGDTGEG